MFEETVLGIICISLRVRTKLKIEYGITKLECFMFYFTDCIIAIVVRCTFSLFIVLDRC